MKDLIERVREFQEPADDNRVSSIIDYLGDTISIKTLEEVVKHYKREEKKILSEDLLEWMHENDQTSFETDDVKVSIKTYVSTKVLDPSLAFPWLISHQYGDLIKDTLDFPKGQLTEDVEHTLEEMGLSYVKKSGIHPQTLKKVISDRLHAGEDLPDEETGIKVNYYDECSINEK